MDINRIIPIGKELNLDEIEITDFLPNYPSLSGVNIFFRLKKFHIPLAKPK
jgi:hypothetical protein